MDSMNSSILSNEYKPEIAATSSFLYLGLNLKVPCIDGADTAVQARSVCASSINLIPNMFSIS